jgi:uncharacterized protein YybS (DUF2232 family)
VKAVVVVVVVAVVVVMIADIVTAMVALMMMQAGVIMGILIGTKYSQAEAGGKARFWLRGTGAIR